MITQYFTKLLQTESPQVWGYVIVVAESEHKCRELMYQKFGTKWGFQYDSLEAIHPSDRTYITTLEQ